MNKKHLRNSNFNTLTSSRQQQDEHVDNLQEVRGQRGQIRQAHELPVVQHHRRLRERQVPPLPRLLQEVRPAQDVRAVQAEVRVRQGRQEEGGSKERSS